MYCGRHAVLMPAARSMQQSAWRGADNIRALRLALLYTRIRGYTDAGDMGHCLIKTTATADQVKQGQGQRFSSQLQSIRNDMNQAGPLGRAVE